MYKTQVCYFSMVIIKENLLEVGVFMRTASWFSMVLVGCTSWLTMGFRAEAAQEPAQQSGLGENLVSSASFSGAGDFTKAIDARSRRQLLNTHNRRRAEVGSPPLFWSEDLAKYAQDWADQLAREGGNLRHRPNVPFGENIYTNFGSQETGRQVVNYWARESQYFVNGVFPNVSTTGNWFDVGHYSQLVWASTSQVGCGMAQTGNQQIWVCNYNSPGNFPGIRPLDR
jgi:hypothetical protein